MNAETRRILDIVDDALVKGNDISQELWDVLSALRGPDFDDRREGVKNVTTVPIRIAAFPRTANKSQMSDSCGRNGYYPTFQRPIKNAFFGFGTSGVFRPWATTFGSDHFIEHVFKAGRVLGLSEVPDNRNEHHLLRDASYVSGVYGTSGPGNSYMPDPFAAQGKMKK